jgi:hypothetical protein
VHEENLQRRPNMDEEWSVLASTISRWAKVVGGTSSTNEVACEMPSPVGTQPASPTFKPPKATHDPGCAQGASRNSPMETSMPSRGAFGDATCRTDGGDRVLWMEALRFD